MTWTSGLVIQLPSQINHLSMWKDIWGLTFVYFSPITARIELRPSHVVNKRSSIELYHQLSHIKPHYLTYYVIFSHIIFDICEFSCLYL